MSYRTLEVNGKPYKYVIGKTHTKICDVGVFPNSVIGIKSAPTCHCGCGMKLNEVYGETVEEYFAQGLNKVKYSVTPDVVRKIIYNAQCVV